jgi:hypothetical protein
MEWPQRARTATQGGGHHDRGGRAREHPPAHPNYCGPALITINRFAEAALSGNMRPRGTMTARAHHTDASSGQSTRGTSGMRRRLRERDPKPLKERPPTPSRACPARGRAGPTREANRPMVHGMAVLRDSCDPLRSNCPTGLFSKRLFPG